MPPPWARRGFRWGADWLGRTSNGFCRTTFEARRQSATALHFVNGCPKKPVKDLVIEITKRLWQILRKNWLGGTVNEGRLAARIMRLTLGTSGRKLIGRWWLNSITAHDEIMPSSVPSSNIGSINPLTAMPVQKSTYRIKQILSTSASPVIFELFLVAFSSYKTTFITTGVIFYGN